MMYNRQGIRVSQKIIRRILNVLGPFTCYDVITNKKAVSDYGKRLGSCDFYVEYHHYCFGGFIGGIPGAIVGAVLPSGKGVPVESFAVKYGNDKVVIREYMHGSAEYKTRMKYVK